MKNTIGWKSHATVPLRPFHTKLLIHTRYNAAHVILSMMRPSKNLKAISVLQRLWKRYRCPWAFYWSCPLAKLRIVQGILLCMIRYFGQSTTIILTHVFIISGWWVTVDFDSQYKILLGETRAQGVYLFWEKTKFKQKICKIIPTPNIIRLTHVAVEGLTYTVLLQPYAK